MFKVLLCLCVQPVVKQETECRICRDEPATKWKDEDIIECSECKSKGTLALQPGDRDLGVLLT